MSESRRQQVCAVFHLLCENISNIGFTADVEDCEGAIGHPFLNRIFFIFNVTIAFSGHVVAPLDASIIIFVKLSREGKRSCFLCLL
jgi:hypothetical protein